MNLRILHCSFINHQSAIEVIFSVVRFKNGKFRGSARLVKTKLPRLGSKFRGPRKTVGNCLL